MSKPMKGDIVLFQNRGDVPQVSNERVHASIVTYVYPSNLNVDLQVFWHGGLPGPVYNVAHGLPSAEGLVWFTRSEAGG